jgi:hypothetical protein
MCALHEIDCTDLEEESQAYRYLTNCTNCWGPDNAELDYMLEHEREVTYRTFVRNCRGPDFRRWLRQHGYVGHARRGMTLKRDRCVEYGKSIFKGRKCYFIRWSAIEFIWVKEKQCRSTI